jgi:hypothetical protein
VARSLALLRSPYSGGYVVLPPRIEASRRRTSCCSSSTLGINAFGVDHSQVLESHSDPVGQSGLIPEIQVLEGLQQTVESMELLVQLGLIKHDRSEQLP